MILSWNILPLWKDKFFLQQKKRRHQWTFFFFCLSPWNLLLYQIWLFCRHRLIYNNDLVRSSRDWKVQLSFFHISSYRKYSTGKIVVILKSVSDYESRYFCSFRHNHCEDSLCQIFFTNIAERSQCMLEFAEQVVFCEHLDEGCLSILF